MTVNELIDKWGHSYRITPHPLTVEESERLIAAFREMREALEWYRDNVRFVDDPDQRATAVLANLNADE